MATTFETEVSQVTEEYNFIPEIECHESAVNGIVSIQVTNISNLWKNGPFQNMHAECFQFIYKRHCESNTEIEDVWRCRDILLGNVSVHGIMHIKFPVHLHQYVIQFALQAMNVNTQQYMTKSRFHSINIPSFLVDDVYQEGDVISFRDDNTFYVKKGQIVQSLPGNKFKLVYMEYVDTMGEAGDSQQKHAWTEKECIIDKSRIYREGLELQYEIDMIDPSEMHKLLLIRKNDEKIVDVFNTMCDVFGEPSLQFCVEQYGLEESLMYCESMSIFVAKNIFDFLYTADFEYKVNCLVDPHNDGRLKMVNLRQSDIRTYYQGRLDGKDMGLAVFDDDDIDYQCDFCRTGLRGWHYVYHCSVDYVDRHDLCLNCVYTIIKLGTELEKWLLIILEDELNLDCVNTIVDYVIGRAFCT
eukprot:416057_1